MGSAARTVNLPLHGGKTYTPLCRHAQHFFSHSAAFTKYISKCRLFPYGLRNRARFLSRQRTAIPPWHLTVDRLFCWESPYFACAQYGLHLRLCARAGALARIRLRPPPQTPPPRGGAQIPCRFRASRSNPQQRRALSKGSTLQSLHYYMVIS